MEQLAALVAVLLLAVVGINYVNNQHEKNKRSKSDGPSPDELVDAAWDEFGGDEPQALLRRRVDRLAKDVKLDKLSQKSTVIQLAIMAARSERLDLLPPLAERAEALDGGCGETRTLRALTEALTGNDLQTAVESIQAAQSAVAGCSKCSSSIESQLLAQELSIAADNLEDRFKALAQERVDPSAPASSASAASPSAPGGLAVRVVRNG